MHACAVHAYTWMDACSSMSGAMYTFRLLSLMCMALLHSSTPSTWAYAHLAARLHLYTITSEPRAMTVIPNDVARSAGA